MTVSAKSTFDAAKLGGGIRADAKKAQKSLDAIVLRDSNLFVPVDTHALEQSALAATVLGSGKVVWNAPYAARQYYGVDFDHSKQRNPRACAKWFEAAKSKFKDKWVEAVNKWIWTGRQK